MSSYLRGWLSSALPTAQSTQSDVVITTTAPQEEDNDSDNDTIRGDNDQDDDLPPAFPSLNSAQRVGAKSAQQKRTGGGGIPDILRSDVDSKLMPPPPVPTLASRRPGVASSSSSSLSVPGSSLMPPPSTSKAPSRRSRKVELAPGYGALDWGNLKKSGKDLRGVDTLLRIPVSVLKQHNKKDDAWSAFNGKVYNITHYLPFHPGGEKELMRVAGRDGTKLFALTHGWVNVDFMLDECLVGFLVPDLS